MTNEYRPFLKSNFIGVNGLFVLIYSNKDDKVIVNGKNFHDQPIDSDIKQYEE